MNLGTRNYSTSDVRILQVDYSQWLKHGYVLRSVTATPSTGAQSTVGTITLSPADKCAFITINAATVNETFTLNVVAKDSFGQTVNDTLTINIVAPGAAQ